MLINGQQQDHLPVSDRAVQYGDGAFETILVRQHVPLLWDAHLLRLKAACETLKIPLNIARIKSNALDYVAANAADGILKIIVSRGSGGRGYGPPKPVTPTYIMQFHALPQDYEHWARVGIAVFKCQHPVSSNSVLGGIKHLNRLDQVMASLELPDDVQEGLMCNDAGTLIEGIKSNVFLLRDERWFTPCVQQAGVAGVMRGQIIDYCKTHATHGITVTELSLEDITTASEVFVSNSVFGIWPVHTIHWGATTLEFTIGEHTRHLQKSVWDAIKCSANA